jgi:predicted dithiol-disulfide oxidoreductase (DUF899 family)
MTTETIAAPRGVSREEWLAERKELLAAEKELTKQYDREAPGLCVFFLAGRDLFRTYSAYGRGTESLTYSYGRQQNFEGSPAGWPPQKPTYE